MKMIAETMPNELKKKRIIFVQDQLWGIITQEAREKEVSISKVVRQKLQEVLL